MSEIAGFSPKVTGNGLGLGHIKGVSTPEETETTTPVGETTGTSDAGGAVVDDVTLTDDAETFIAGTGPDEPTGPGKSHQSTAHRAFAMLQEFGSLAGMPFGKIVSTLARTGSIESLLPPPPAPEAEEVSEEEPSEVPSETASEVPVEGETDPAADTADTLLTEAVEPLVAPEISPEDSAIIDLLEEIADGPEEELDLTLDLPDMNDETEAA